MKEAENILRILKETKEAIHENDSYKIKNLSNQTVHTATIAQDSDNIVIAVLIYALSKIIEREHYRPMPGWDKFYTGVLKNLDSAISALEKNNIEKYRDSVGEMRNSINDISGNLKDYIKDVFAKAGINKAFRMYEHGLSSKQTADLLGVSLWDLASYIGQSSVSEAKLGHSLPVKERIKIAEDIFR